jgi:hypothetical protein
MAAQYIGFHSKIRIAQRAIFATVAAFIEMERKMPKAPVMGAREWTTLIEALLPRHLVGMALIGAGLALIDGRPLQIARRHWRKLIAARQPS